MQVAIAGLPVAGSSNFHAIKSIEFSHSNILTGASFNPPPRKTIIQIIIDFLNKRIEP
ncbi:hypothetical protein JHU04_002465 [Brenneria sp. 4F2]|nr:hypothetical protein [Brenneria bubanii]